jgi:hypothetical protein
MFKSQYPRDPLFCVQLLKFTKLVQPKFVRVYCDDEITCRTVVSPPESYMRAAEHGCCSKIWFRRDSGAFSKNHLSGASPRTLKTFF